MSDQIPFKHSDLEKASHDKRFHSIWESVAFRLGAMWAISHIYKHKSSQEIYQEMEIPTITYDAN